MPLLLFNSFLSALLVLSSCDREDARRGLPIWHDGMEMAASKQPQRVFVTSDLHDVVILASDGSPDRLSAARISLNNGILPVFRVSVSLSRTTYRYEYTVESQEGAVDGIFSVSIIAPPFFPSAVVDFRPDHPGGAPWPGAASPTVLDRASEMGAHVPGRVVIWLPDGPPQQVDAGKLNIMPGQTKGVFIISAPLLPGFTTGKAAGLPYDPSEGLLYAPRVQQQIAPLEDYFQTTTLTLGPMFPPDAPAPEILANYLTGIARLLRCNGIPHTPAFLDEIMKILGEDGIESKLVNELGRQKTKPGSPIEEEILKCLRLVADSFATRPTGAREK